MRQIVVRLCTRIILIAAVVGAGWVHVVFAQFTADEHLPEGLGIAQFTPSDELSKDETLEQLLMRLETAIEKAIEEDIFIDEINNGPDDRI